MVKENSEKKKEKISEKKDQTVRFTVSVPRNLHEEFEKLRIDLNMTRSDGIRKAMQLFITDQTKNLSNSTNKPVWATISYVEKSHIHSHPPTNDHSHSSTNEHSHSLTYEHSHSSTYEHSHSSTNENSHLHTNEHTHKIKDENDEKIKEGHTHEPTGKASYYPGVDHLEYIKANEIQHQFLDIIISTMHIHAGPESCMLILAVKGPYTRIQELFNELQSLKTIANIQLTLLDTA